MRHGGFWGLGRGVVDQLQEWRQSWRPFLGYQARQARAREREFAVGGVAAMALGNG